MRFANFAPYSVAKFAWLHWHNYKHRLWLVSDWRFSQKNKPNTKGIRLILNPSESDSAVNFTGTQATGANVDTFYRTINNCSYLLNVRFPSAFRMSIGMADVTTSLNTFAANFANGCHESHLLNVIRASVTNLTEVSYHRMNLKARDF